MHDPTSFSWRRWLSSRGLFAAWCCAAGAALAIASPWFASLPAALAWWAGLAVHWQWLYLPLGLLGALCALSGGRSSAWAAAALVVAGWALHLRAVPDATDHGPALSVATANVHVENRDPQRLLAWLLSPQRPDVIVLQEFTAPFGAALDAAGGQALRDAFPHRSLHPQPDPFGIAVLSRWPLPQQQRVEPANAFATLKLRLMIDWAGQPVAFAAVHPMPPVAPAYATERDSSLLAEAGWLAGAGVPGLMAGDFNDTPWSSGLKPLRPHLGRASGLAPTWPNAWGWLSVLPLDHVLATGDWAQASHAVGPDIGSDHRPVVVSMRLRR